MYLKRFAKCQAHKLYEVSFEGEVGIYEISKIEHRTSAVVLYTNRIISWEDSSDSLIGISYNTYNEYSRYVSARNSHVFADEQEFLEKLKEC